jgi:hypothetical protein
MPWSLDWFAAKALAQTGSQIRRVGWTTQWMILHDGIWMLQTATTSAIVQATDFGADEFAARDWTDQPYGADQCGATPGYNTSPVTYTPWTSAPVFTPPPPPGFVDS